MNDTQTQIKLSALNAKVLAQYIVAMGMSAENSQHPHDQPYGADDFRDVADKANDLAKQITSLADAGHDADPLAAINLPTPAPDPDSWRLQNGGDA